jgi:acetyltransferase-like isoleucine patch superfamily enzyme
MGVRTAVRRLLGGKRAAKPKASGGGASLIDEYRRMGVKIGKDCTIFRVTFDSNFPFLIEIGDEVQMSGGTTVLAHDASPSLFTGKARLGKVRIEGKTFVGQDCLILPGVTIGRGCIIGAGSVVSRDIPPDSVAAGSPAKRICSVEEYLARPLRKGLVELPYINPPREDPFFNEKRAEGIALVRRLLAEGKFD